ncbi:winged helix-turn-helix domain-containing protein [Mesorhizobium sp. BH1-1-5]|nr:winged helix-turn-helix domain-containing protein [Mesorhizobium sp. BH1-1-5]
MTAGDGRSARPATLVDGVVRRLQAEISSGTLPSGHRLLSIRKAAEEFGVSKNTIVEAYDRLVAAGALMAKAGFGFLSWHPPGKRPAPRDPDTSPRQSTPPRFSRPSWSRAFRSASAMGGRRRHGRNNPKSAAILAPMAVPPTPRLTAPRLASCHSGSSLRAGSRTSTSGPAKTTFF